MSAGLRFHDLAEKSLRHDEAVTANISRGTLSEVVSGTRSRASSPILYPLGLYAVQKVESTPFSIRLVPATASILTVALMLLLLPRLGVARGAAFLAALLATLSVEAIRHAQDGREYSIDALVVLLMLAGLLRYLRDSKKVLLCASLFVAPLVQYGLVLFGVAVIGAAAIAPRTAGPDWRSAPAAAGRIGERRRQDTPRCLFVEARDAAPAFVRFPRRRGVAERFVRTLREQFIQTRGLESVEARSHAIRGRRVLCHKPRLVRRPRHRSPAPVRRDQAAPGRQGMAGNSPSDKSEALPVHRPSFPALRPEPCDGNGL